MFLATVHDYGQNEGTYGGKSQNGDEEEPIH
jgi:hypothetical protein